MKGVRSIRTRVLFAVSWKVLSGARVFLFCHYLLFCILGGTVSSSEAICPGP